MTVPNASDRAIGCRDGLRAVISRHGRHEQCSGKLFVGVVNGKVAEPSLAYREILLRFRNGLAKPGDAICQTGPALRRRTVQLTYSLFSSKVA